MSQEKFVADFLEATDFRDPVEVTLESELRNLPDWDSLAALGVIVMFDMKYKKTVTGDQLEKAVTIGDLYKLVG
jgi:acyl carrier protein